MPKQDPPAQWYWNCTGAHQALYKRLHKQLIPSEGKALESHGRLLQAMLRLYHDRYNNGLCNIRNVMKDHFPPIYEVKDRIIAKLPNRQLWDNLVSALSIHEARERRAESPLAWLANEYAERRHEQFMEHFSSYVEDNEFAEQPFPDDALEAVFDAVVLIVAEEQEAVCA